MTSRTSRTSRAAIRARRAAALVAVGAVGLVVACTLAPFDIGPQDDSYPPAPDQQLPEPADGTAGSRLATPVARLADPTWVRETAARTGVPERALGAYAGAALRTAETHPGCGIGWNTLAGVGEVETDHGRHDGSSVDAAGRVTPPILGVALDGDGVMAVPDTDDGALDGDERWDRAVGPMQFIPATWQAHAQDGDLDGTTDVHQYDDAALTAAVYLCRSGGDLTSDDGWTAALARYNRSAAYARDVAEHAEDYGEPAA